MEATKETSIFDLWREVQMHPDYIFGTIFVPGDFPDEKVPDDFSANRATDRLCEVGNEYIDEYAGPPGEDDWEASDGSDIFALMDRVRQHPDYIFGTFFVPGDFPGGVVPDDFNTSYITDKLAETGNEYIDFMVGYSDDD